MSRSPPVTGAELDAIARAQNVTVEAGDALMVYSGREAFVRTAGRYGGVTEPRPGLDSSCARFIRDRDVAVLVWDMHDAVPDKNNLPFPAHAVLYTYGVALVDNALLEPLAQACAEERATNSCSWRCRSRSRAERAVRRIRSLSSNPGDRLNSSDLRD